MKMKLKLKGKWI